MVQRNEKPVVSRAHLTFVWIIVAVLVLIAFGMTPWDAIRGALAGEGASLLRFVAGYALPLVVGTAVSVGLFLRNRATGKDNGLEFFGFVALILLVSGFLSGELGLGLAPDFTAGQYYGANPIVSALIFAATAYLNTYGLGLTFAAVLIGSAAALHVDARRDDPGGLIKDASSLLKPE